MKVATWNLDQLKRNKAKWARQLKQIESIRADVWVFTETYFDLSPGDDYECVACSKEVKGRQSTDARWVAIWCRRASRAMAVELRADPERCAAAQFGGVVIVGTVFPWLGDARQHPEKGSAAFQARLAEQAVDWKRLRDEHRGRVCVAGDFNQDLLREGHYYHSAASRVVLLAALEGCGLTCLTGGTDDPLAKVKGLASIDHICIGEGLHAKKPAKVWPEHGALTKQLSDHYGAWAEFDLA